MESGGITGIILLVILAIIILSGILFLKFLSDPVPWGEKLDESGGSLPADKKPYDVLLLIDKTRLEHKDDFQSLDFSAAWINFIEQEYGTDAVRDISIGQYSLPGRLLIISRSASKTPPSDTEETMLREFIRDGGIVIIEMPGPEWRGITPAWSGKVIPIESRNPAPTTGVPALNKVLDEGPFVSDLYSIEGSPDRMSVVMTCRGKPAILRKDEGKGAVLLVNFDFGKQLVSIQQGKPSDDFTVRRGRGRIPFLIETQDLTADSKFLNNTIPWADLLEKALACEVDKIGPVPRWWYAPMNRTGTVISTHDEESLGGKSLLPLITMERKGYFPSTFFIMTGKDLKKRFSDAGSRPKDMGEFFDMELHWNRFTPTASLKTQKHWLENFVGKKVQVNRIHFLLWGKDYAKPFGVMEAAGLAMDSSYGPNRGRGYLFCTGLPFHPLDESGLPFRIRELPFQVQENWGGATPAFLDQLIRENADNYHLALVTLYHPHKVMKDEDARNRYIEQIDEARRLGLWATSMVEYHVFWEERLAAKIESHYKGGVLDMEVGGLEGGLTVAFPGGAEKVLLDGDPANVTEVDNTGEKLMLLTIPGGAHRVRVTYK